MLTVVAFVLSFVASTLAYRVTFPNEESGWTNTGSQFVNWSMVDTDPSNFTIYLTNQQLPGFQSEVLLAFVVGSTLSAIVSPPSAGWVPGGGYRVNFIKDPNDPDTILAQSDNFNITSGSSTISNTGGTTSTGTTINPTAATSTTGTVTDSSASNSASILPTSSSAAGLSYPVQSGLLGLFSLLGFALA